MEKKEGTELVPVTKKQVARGARAGANLATKADINVNRLLLEGIKQHLDPSAMREILAMRKELLAEDAAKQFTEALARFQKKVGPVVRNRIVKNKREKVEAGDAEEVRFRYAELTKIIEAVGKDLAEEGFTYTFDSGEFSGGDAAKFLPVYCDLTHKAGHSRRTTFPSVVSFSEGAKIGMSANQVVTAAFSWGCRQAFIKALGLMTADPEPEEENKPMAQPEAVGGEEGKPKGEPAEKSKDVDIKELYTRAIELARKKSSGTALKRFMGSAEAAFKANDSRALFALRNTLNRMADLT